MFQEIDHKVPVVVWEAYLFNINASKIKYAINSYV